ncbi:ATP-binding cassette domain-containing protein [Pseudooceanicola nanhaiensis]|uniref:ATP-binding cassette domain-containing protein n=1 Tax=Pseudooceanicola nanhaiensis TaxID=375761 RepID=UPI001CD44ABB|nr:ATP-binding cassette domain-containing protein [Pseudooceanicola nanhaiensis]MCA0920165.1 ATP-binding cassette domain-containing protein [Pseudooceanicola nanhaiensis]
MIEIHIDHRQGDFSLRVDLELEAHGIIGLIGPSGSGKSTLFSCLAGHVTPARGCIRVAGRQIFDSTARINLRPARRGIGVVFQDGLLFPHMSVARNLAYGARNRGTDFWHEVVEALDLAHLLEARPGRLSGGERQRAAIARALMAEPDLLLLDEPVSALDPGLKARTLELIARVQGRTGIPMIFISHAPEEVRQLCREVVTMEGGRIAGPVRAGTTRGCRLVPVGGGALPLRAGGRA